MPHSPEVEAATQVWMAAEGWVAAATEVEKGEAAREEVAVAVKDLVVAVKDLAVTILEEVLKGKVGEQKVAMMVVLREREHLG